MGTSPWADRKGNGWAALKRELVDRGCTGGRRHLHAVLNPDGDFGWERLKRAGVSNRGGGKRCVWGGAPRLACGIEPDGGFDRVGVEVSVDCGRHSNDFRGRIVLGKVLGQQRRVRVGHGATDEDQTIQPELCATGLGLGELVGRADHVG
eukprot:scaffold1261_cov74-Isochrysis_galbana.AAC.2